MEKYTEQYPVIVLRSRKSKLPPLDKHKFLLSGDMTLAQVSLVLSSPSVTLSFSCRGFSLRLKMLPQNSPICLGKHPQFQAVIRRRSKLEQTQTIYVYVVDDAGKYSMPQTSQTIRAIYNQHKDEDGFLYVTYFQDDAFGTSGAPPATVAIAST